MCTPKYKLLSSPEWLGWFIKRFTGVIKQLKKFHSTIIVYCRVSVVQRFTFVFHVKLSLKRKKFNTIMLSCLIKTYLMDLWYCTKIKILVVFCRKQFYHDITPLTYKCHNWRLIVRLLKYFNLIWYDILYQNIQFSMKITCFNTLFLFCHQKLQNLADKVLNIKLESCDKKEILSKMINSIWCIDWLPVG